MNILLHNVAVPGIILNILLLYLIKRFSAKGLGAYKYLLSIFAVYDIYLTIMHAIIDLGAVVTEHFYGVVSYNHLDTSAFAPTPVRSVLSPSNQITRRTC
ncbi:hypothetical protein PFISCL1PPCAC_22787 [Pristionchus fissidentatus]|uniref:G protein-coupled receptor n=1 Tax=Pristionchus fissidentatus TaxID=1538716 RepID=A0AAV5WIK2_9BILA|nr:hypothetical protein PFISCL1PPCAC_22787 [Pristionchus fissidentatus]